MTIGEAWGSPDQASHFFGCGCKGIIRQREGYTFQYLAIHSFSLRCLDGSTRLVYLAYMDRAVKSMALAQPVGKQHANQSRGGSQTTPQTMFDA